MESDMTMIALDGSSAARLADYYYQPASAVLMETAFDFPQCADASKRYFCASTPFLYCVMGEMHLALA